MSHVSKKQKLSNTKELASSSKYDGIPLPKDENQKAKTNNDTGEISYNAALELHKCKSYSKALTFYRSAAHRGHSLAQNGVGVMHLYGLGTPIDYKLAMDWFVISASNDGNKISQGNIGRLYHLGLGVPKNIHSAIEWYTKSANQGHYIYQFCLAQIYEKEEEVKDLQKSVDWYKKALDNGLKSVQKDIKRLKKKGYSPRYEEKEILEKAGKEQAENNIESKESTENVEINKDDEQERLPFVNQNDEMIKKLEEGFQLKLGILEKERAEREKLLEETIEEIKQLKEKFAYYKTGLELNSRNDK